MAVHNHDYTPTNTNHNPNSTTSSQSSSSQQMVISVPTPKQLWGGGGGGGGVGSPLSHASGGVGGRLMERLSDILRRGTLVMVSNYFVRRHFVGLGQCACYENALPYSNSLFYLCLFSTTKD